ncbi:unnamed protein product, partial [Mesorhabditis spiculigera]
MKFWVLLLLCALVADAKIANEPCRSNDNCPKGRYCTWYGKEFSGHCELLAIGHCARHDDCPGSAVMCVRATKGRPGYCL